MSVCVNQCVLSAAIIHRNAVVDFNHTAAHTHSLQRTDRHADVRIQNWVKMCVWVWRAIQEVCECVTRYEFFVWGECSEHVGVRVSRDCAFRRGWIRPGDSTAVHDVFSMCCFHVACAKPHIATRSTNTIMVVALCSENPSPPMFTHSDIQTNTDTTNTTKTHSRWVSSSSSSSNLSVDQKCWPHNPILCCAWLCGMEGEGCVKEMMLRELTWCGGSKKRRRCGRRFEVWKTPAHAQTTKINCYTPTTSEPTTSEPISADHISTDHINTDHISDDHIGTDQTVPPQTNVLERVERTIFEA